MRFYIPNNDNYPTHNEDGHKARTAVAVKRGIPHACVDLPLLLSVEAKGVCITISGSSVRHCIAIRV
jgi:hypothetical protein